LLVTSSIVFNHSTNVDIPFTLLRHLIKLLQDEATYNVGQMVRIIIPKVPAKNIIIALFFIFNAAN
jgi:hypothetical protein